MHLRGSGAGNQSYIQACSKGLSSHLFYSLLAFSFDQMMQNIGCQRIDFRIIGPCGFHFYPNISISDQNLLF